MAALSLPYRSTLSPPSHQLNQIMHVPMQQKSWNRASNKRCSTADSALSESPRGIRSIHTPLIASPRRSEQYPEAIDSSLQQRESRCIDHPASAASIATCAKCRFVLITGNFVQYFRHGIRKPNLPRYGRLSSEAGESRTVRSQGWLMPIFLKLCRLQSVIYNNKAPRGRPDKIWSGNSALESQAPTPAGALRFPRPLRLRLYAVLHSAPE